MKISEVMQQLRDEAKRRHESTASAHNGAAETIESGSLPPAPPRLHLTPLRDDVGVKFEDVQRRAEEKTKVSRSVPKFLRRLFRKQGAFNEQVLEADKFLMKESREASKRLREIAAYLQAENGWLDGVMEAFVKIHRALQRRIDNQYSLEARLLALDHKVDDARSDSLRKLQHLEESLLAITSVLDAEKNARRAGETVAERVSRQDVRLDGLSDTLTAVRGALFDEATAREAVAERVSKQHARLDGLSDTLEAIREALFDEAKAREAVEDRLHKAQLEALSTRGKEDHGVASLSRTVNELKETIQFVKAENDRLSREQEAGRAALQDLLTRTEERQLADSSYIKRELNLHSESLALLHGSARSNRGRKGLAALPVSPSALDQHKFDSFYLAFENQFRGSRAAIKRRVRVYLPLVRKARAGNQQSPVLDLGCGRGELLELLRDEDLVARGIDLNRFMVSECVERKLDVVQADVIEHLATISSESQGAITALHLIEHLPFPTLTKLFAESLRVLRPGGICIFETPNPDNLQVGSSRFYCDPTHVRPLPHPLTEFIMSTTGFKQVEILPLHPDDHAVPIADEARPVERFAHQMFFGAQDYAVIGHK